MRNFPFSPRSTRELEVGDLIAVPREDGRWGCLQVTDLKRSGSGSRTTLVVGILPWVGEHPPTSGAVSRLSVVEQALTRIEIFTEGRLEVVATSSLVPHGLPSNYRDFGVGTTHNVLGWKAAIARVSALDTRDVTLEASSPTQSGTGSTDKALSALAPPALSISSVLGDYGSVSRLWKESIGQIRREVMKHREGITSPVSLTVVYHVHGSNAPLNFRGVRTGYFSKLESALIVQAAVSELEASDRRQVLLDLLSASVREAEKYVVRKKLVPALPEIWRIVNRLA